MRTARYVLAALVIAGAIATGCSSNSGGGADSGTDSPITTHHDSGGSGTGSHSGSGSGGTDAGSSTGSGSGGTDAGSSSGSGSGSGCTFQSYVTNLINTDTTATATPDGTLGAGCTDTGAIIPINTLTP